MTRDATLADFLSLAMAALSRRMEAAGSEANAALGTIRRRVAAGLDAEPAAEASRPPVCRHLGPALEALAAAGGDIAALAEPLARLCVHLQWRPRQSDDPVFTAGHANAELLGPTPGALANRDDLRVGLSLVAPGITYPDHRHPPEEVYLVLSDGDWRQAAKPWHTPGIGGVVYNPPNIIHAMRAKATPLLALWMLPLDRAA